MARFSLPLALPLGFVAPIALGPLALAPHWPGSWVLVGLYAAAAALVRLLPRTVTFDAEARELVVGTDTFDLAATADGGAVHVDGAVWRSVRVVGPDGRVLVRIGWLRWAQASSLAAELADGLGLPLHDPRYFTRVFARPQPVALSHDGAEVRVLSWSSEEPQLVLGLLAAAGSVQALAIGQWAACLAGAVLVASLRLDQLLPRPVRLRFATDGVHVRSLLGRTIFLPADRLLLPRIVNGYGAIGVLVLADCDGQAVEVSGRSLAELRRLRDLADEVWRTGPALPELPPDVPEALEALRGRVGERESTLG